MEGERKITCEDNIEPDGSLELLEQDFEVNQIKYSGTTAAVTGLKHPQPEDYSPTEIFSERNSQFIDKEDYSIEHKDECVLVDDSETPEDSEPKEVKDEDVEVALLPPDHPLMQKFQQTLREYLLRMKEVLKNELGEMEDDLKKKHREREAKGLKLYDLQEKIKAQTEQLEDFTKNIIEVHDHRVQQEDEQKRMENQYDNVVKQVKDQKALYNQRLAELENAQNLDTNLTQWTDTIEDEVKNAQRMVSRDTQLQRQISEEKSKADLLYFHVDMEVRRNEREKQIVFEELTEMRKAVETLNMSVANANTDLEALQNEHKKLNQAWGEVIIAISHRDKVLLQVQIAIDKEKEFIKLANANIEGIRKQIKKEMEQNEKLEAFKLRLLNDLNSLKRECQKEAEILGALQVKLDQLPIFMNQTEFELHEAKKEGTQIETEMRRIDWKLGKKCEKKYEIEEMILKLAQDRLINDKASEYRLKILRNAQEQRRTMELNLSQTQNQLAITLLDMEKWKSTIIKLREENSHLDDLLAGSEVKANDTQAELKQMEYQIDIKLVRLDKYNKQLDELMRSIEGAGSPTELKIKAIEKSLQLDEQKIREYQEFWLMLQNHYVNLSQKRNQQLNEIQITRKQLSIIKQKSLKIDDDLMKMEESSREIDREIQNYVSRTHMLNAKMSRKRQQHEAEETECELEHATLLDKLKNHEMEVLELEQEISDLQTEITQHKDLVIDKHREALTWETKYKMIEETLRWRKDEGTAQSEVSQMKSEIHRMRIRHQQLQRAQEKLVQDLDHAVIHREQIFVSTRTKQIVESRNRTKTNATLQQKVSDIRVKLHKVQAEVSILKEVEAPKASKVFHEMQSEVKRLRSEIARVNDDNKRMIAEIEECALKKRQNLENIVRKQSRAKTYKSICVCKTAAKLPRSADVLDMVEQKQIDMTDNLTDLLQSLATDFPEKKLLFESLLKAFKL